MGSDFLRLALADEDGVGSVAEIRIDLTPSFAPNGWGEGEHYVLARDADGWSITEPGERHREVYVSPDGRWGADGLTPETAIPPWRYERLLREELRVNPADASSGLKDASWHVYFERGHDYGNYAPVFASGENALHPFVLGAYGEGHRPIFGADIKLYGNTTSNLVVRDLAFEQTPATQAIRGEGAVLRGIDIIDSGHENILYENVLLRPLNGTARIQTESDNVTLYRTIIQNAHRTAPIDPEDGWHAFNNRTQGLFVNHVDGLLIEDSQFNHNGWRWDYFGGAHSPSKFSHNLYVNVEASDVTVRDSVFSRGASFGAQLRGGGVVDGNLFFENNVALDVGQGFAYSTRPVPQASLVLDNVITAPSDKWAPVIGAQGWGMGLRGEGFATDLIIHGDAAASRNGFTTHWTPPGAYPRYQDIRVFDWGSSQDWLPDELLNSKAWLRQHSIDSVAETLLGDGANRRDLIIAQKDRDRSDWTDTPGAAEVVDEFRDIYRLDPRTAVAPRTVTFEGEARAEGFRWDNRTNWTDDIGPANGDAVALDGWAVTFGGETLSVTGLDFGQGGALRVVSGLLAVDGALTAGALGGAVTTVQAGQFLFDGYAGTGPLSLTAAGGRIANTGVTQGATILTVRDGQAILAEGDGAFTLGAGARLAVEGDDGRVGFDDLSGEAALRLIGGELSFDFDRDGVSTIAEFRSGRHGVAAPGVTSVVALESGDLSIDLTDFDGGRRRTTLIDVDRLEGDLSGLTVRIDGAQPHWTPALVWDDAAAALHLDLW